MRTKLMVLLVVGIAACGAENNGDLTNATPNSVSNTSNDEPPETCEGRVLDVGGAEYCITEVPDTAGADDMLCPVTHPTRATGASGLLVCTADGSASNQEIYAAYDAEVCAPATSAAACEENSCHWAEAADHWFYDAGMCVQADAGVCVAAIARGNDTPGCLFRDLDDGRQEGVATPALYFESAWEGGLDTPNDVCPCVLDG